jgi:hypothetical protein
MIQAFRDSVRRSDRIIVAYEEEGGTYHLYRLARAINNGKTAQSSLHQILKYQINWAKIRTQPYIVLTSNQNQVIATRFHALKRMFDMEKSVSRHRCCRWSIFFNLRESHFTLH